MTWRVDNVGPDTYGASADMLDHAEGSRPYAWSFYRMLQGAMGSAYSKQLSGHLHAEHLAEARMHAGAMRAAEKLFTNSLAHLADESLGYWVNVTGVTVYSDDTDVDVRAKCHARMILQSSNAQWAIDSACRAILRDAFVSILRFRGSDLDNPPTRTHWAVNPGPTSFDLGFPLGEPHYPHLTELGAWMSDRCRILVIVDRNAGFSEVKLKRLVNVDVADLLSRRLPAWTHWNWAYSDCFRLGTSELGVNALCEAES